ncbi:MAG: hypothetical protein WCP59_17520 [Actinomycetota bacterium]
MAHRMETQRRITDLVLGLDYGDEQERLRYYETYAVAVHLQLIGLPVAGAAIIAVAGRSATGPVLIMLAAAFVAILIGLAHLKRHHVRAESIAMSKRNRGYLIVCACSWLALVSAIAVRGSSKSGFQSGMAKGAVVGLVIALVAMAVNAWCRRHGVDAASDEA